MVSLFYFSLRYGSENNLVSYCPYTDGLTEIFSTIKIPPDTPKEALARNESLLCLAENSEKTNGS